MSNSSDFQTLLGRKNSSTLSFVSIDEDVFEMESIQSPRYESDNVWGTMKCGLENNSYREVKFCAVGYQSLENGYQYEQQFSPQPRIHPNSLSTVWNLPPNIKLILKLIGSFDEKLDSKTTFDLKEFFEDLTSFVVRSNAWFFIQLSNFVHLQIIGDFQQQTLMFADNKHNIPVIGIYTELEHFEYNSSSNILTVQGKDFTQTLNENLHYYIFTSRRVEIEQNDCFECTVLCNGSPSILPDIFDCIKKNKCLIILRGSGGIADILAECMTSGRKRSIYVIVHSYFKDLPDVDDEEISEGNQINCTIHTLVQQIEDILKLVETPFQEIDVKEKLNDTKIAEIILKSITDTLETIKRRSESASLDTSNLNKQFLLLCLHLNQLNVATEFGSLWKYAKENDPICKDIVQEALKQKRFEFIRYMFEQGLGHEALMSDSMLPENPTMFSQNDSVYVNVTDKFPLGTPKDGLDYLFKKSIMHQQHEFSTLIWRKLSSPIGAALFAYGMLKEMKRLEEDDDKKHPFSEQMKSFQKIAIETINITYTQMGDSAIKLLGQTLSNWGNKNCMMLALETENRTFLSQTACRKFTENIWRTGSSNPENEVNIDTVQECRVCKSNARRKLKGRCYRCLIRWILSPSILALLRFISYITFLAVYALFLLFWLRAEKIEIVEWILITWIISCQLEKIMQFKNKDKMSTIETTELVAGLFFFVAWIFRVYGCITPPPYSDYLMDIARIMFSIDYIAYTMCISESFYALRHVGAFIRIIISLMKIMKKFLLFMAVFFFAYAIASESILYPNTDTVNMFFHVFRRPLWAMVGEFRLEEFNENCSSNYYCSRDYRRGSPSEIGQYFVPVLMGIYIIIVNILLFSLLVAVFNSKIRVIEERANEVWNYQFLLITMKYYKKIFLPLPFTILFPFLLYCVGVKQGRPFHQEILPTELSKLQRIEASMRFKFIQDTDDQQISVICNGVVLCPHKAETKIMRSNETQTERVMPLTIGLWTKPPHHQNPLDQTKKLLLPPEERPDNDGLNEPPKIITSEENQEIPVINISEENVTITEQIPPADQLLSTETSTFLGDVLLPDIGESTT